jgi:hypothetical protein
LLPKVSDEEIRYEGTHDRVSEVFPIQSGEKILGVSMGKITIHCCLILDIRKKMDRCNIDLDETESSLLVGRVPDELNGLSGKIIMDLRCVKILNAQRSWADGTNNGNGISLDYAKQLVQEVVKLEDLVGSTCNVRPLGNRTHVGECRRNNHANGNERYTNNEC